MQLVSIVVPIFNVESCLGYCISSILKQTYKNLEVILVNDGSNDGSLEICYNYKELDDRIKVIDMLNSGVGNARNVGIRAARGEYIIFIDSDDIISPNMVEELYYKSKLYGKDLVICGMKLISSDGKHGICNDQYTFEAIGTEVVYSHDVFIKKLPELLWKSALMESPCNRIYRMHIIRDNELEFPIDTEYGEDFLFNLEYYRRCNGAVLLNQLYYYYVFLKKDSLSHKYKKNLFENQMRLMEALKCLLIQESVWAESDKKSFYEYVVAHTINCIQMLFHENGNLNEEQIKRELVIICQKKIVREGFQQVDWLPPGTELIIRGMEKYDIGSTYEYAKKLYVDKTDVNDLE